MLNFKCLRDPRSAIDQERGQKRIQAFFFQNILSCCCFVGKGTFSVALSMSDVIHLLPAVNTHSTFLKPKQGCWALQQSWSMSPIYSLVLQAYLFYPSWSNALRHIFWHVMWCERQQILWLDTNVGDCSLLALPASYARGQPCNHINWSPLHIQYHVLVEYPFSQAKH